jgi:hypothetical protein
MSKNKIFIIVIIFALIIISSLFLIENNPISSLKLTGLITEENIENPKISNSPEDLESTLTKEEIIEAINKAKTTIQEMKTSNLPTAVVEDTLLEAERTFEIAKNAEILRDKSLSPEEKADAKKSLELIEWENIDYSDVIPLLNQIEKRKKDAFELQDSIIAAMTQTIDDPDQEVSLEVFLSPNFSPIEDEKTLDLLDQINESFYEDRFEDTESLLDQLKNYLEQKKIDSTTINSLKNNTKNFIQRNWILIIITLIAISVVIYFSYRKISIYLTEKKIKKLKAKKIALVELIKKAQIERYKDNSISNLVYNIKMKNYKEKLNEIKEDLPVLEKKLDRLNKIRKIK